MAKNETPQVVQETPAKPDTTQIEETKKEESKVFHKDGLFLYAE